MKQSSGIIALLLSILPLAAFAGNLDAPGTVGSNMPTTTQIYNRLDTGAVIPAPNASQFTEPSAGPSAGSARTLAEIGAKLPVADNANGAAADDVLSGKTFWGLRTDGTWGLKSGAYAPALAKRVNKTGQTGCWNANGTSISCTGTGQDGAHQYGIDPAIMPTATDLRAYSTPAYTGTRFIDNGNGTVTDTLTALIWLKNANCFSSQIWNTALASANSLASGSCDLTDGSTAGQWRLPNINELHSLGPAWPPGSPFTSVQSSHWYWSSSSVSSSTTYSWLVYVSDGSVNGFTKANNNYVWPVRGGQ